jgi:Raf kinase inhibitor-like YbhB/YbcL family protein
VIIDLNADTHALGEGVPQVERLSDGAIQGRNSARKIGYYPPCPPPGPAHRYRFTIDALDRLLRLRPGSDKRYVLDAMQGHVLDQGQLIGLHQRQGG